MAVRAIIAGSRSFNDRKIAFNELDQLFKNVKDIVVVCGEAKGGDAIGKEWANLRGHDVYSMPAHWDDGLSVKGAVIGETADGRKYNKAAGHIRNRAMIDFATEPGHKGCLVAFWDGRSPGTKNIIKLAEKKDLLRKVVVAEPNDTRAPEHKTPNYDAEYEELVSELERKWLSE